MATAPRRSLALLCALCLVFAILATANSGGYRYGVGDQAFYEPATQLRLHPELFPRDRAILESQAKLTSVDEILASATRVTGLAPTTLFFVLYVVSLIVLFFGVDQVAQALGFSPWASAAFLALMTLRHRITKTGANTLEGYMHPRQLAFGLGALAIASSLKNHWWWTLGLLGIAAAIHPTTATWFAVLIAGGMIIDELAIERGTSFVWLLLSGVLASAWIVSRTVSALPAGLLMDPVWAAVFAAKDYVFVSTWPAYAWVVNVAYLPVLWLIYTRRERAGVAHPLERRLVAGGLALLTVFIASVFFSESHVALAVQLQVSRVFWLTDFLAAGYVAWWLTSDPAVIRIAGQRAPVVAVALLAIVAAGRGVFVLSAAGSDRALVRLDIPNDDWARTMAWLRTQPADWHILADPDHAWKQGTSVRVAASRDVVLENVKDSAISLYDRNVALRVAERTAALGHFAEMSADQFRDVARRYDATVLVTDAQRTLALPRLYTNASFVVYDLR